MGPGAGEGVRAGHLHALALGRTRLQTQPPQMRRLEQSAIDVALGTELSLNHCIWPPEAALVWTQWPIGIGNGSPPHMSSMV